MTTTHLPPQAFRVDSQGVADLDLCKPLIADALIDVGPEIEVQSSLEEN
jgi:hypothetical protein